MCPAKWISRTLVRINRLALGSRCFVDAPQGAKPSSGVSRSGRNLNSVTVGRRQSTNAKSRWPQDCRGIDRYNGILGGDGNGPAPYRMNKRITAISEEFMTALVRHSWPGNIRELQNFIERSVILSSGDVLSGSRPELTCKTPEDSRLLKSPAPVTLEQAESSHILQTLQETKGVIGGRNGAAARLGLPRTTLMYKMRRLGINRGRNYFEFAEVTRSSD